MENEIIIGLKSRQTVKGRLVRPFVSSDVDVEIFDGESGRRMIFALEEVCTIRFPETLPGMEGVEAEGLEEVQTITGETFRVAVYAMSFRKGFISLLEAAATHRTIFFTTSGVRCRREMRRIGEILHDKGLVTEEEITGALRAQEELRSRRIGEIIADAAEINQEEIERSLDKTGVTAPRGNNIRVGDILVEAGLVTREQVEKAFESQQKGKRLRVGELLVQQGLISEDQLLAALAAKFRMRVVDLSTVIPSEEAIGAISQGLANRLRILPIALEGRRLVVATSSPTNHSIGDSLRFSTNLNIEMVAAPARQIGAAIDRYYNYQQQVGETPAESVLEEQAVTPEEEPDEVRIAESDSEVIATLNRVLLDAYRRGASDIHFEPGSGKNPLLVRYRIDGECFIAQRIAASYKSAIIARIKIVSGLDIAERRRPQSGKILFRHEQKRLEFRVEITPTVGGQQDAVLRLLAASRPLPVEEIGLIPHNLERFKELLAKPYGIILCVGPTGSGKTTTLHSALGHINTPSRKIWTVEDPVEITQLGLRQVQVNPKIGFGFAEALRSFLRADPDVIMVGEMRDAETAKIAIEASLTGHLVFSTLHTNSAAETVVRLVDMGMDPFNFADALLGVIAQRLARRLCNHCKQAVKPGREEYDGLVAAFAHDAGREPEFFPPYSEATLMSRKGCEQCGGSGYKGRIAIHELMVCSPAVKSGIRSGIGVDDLRRTALGEGMWTLRMDGIMKVIKGYTDMEQIWRVCL